ncbi:MAG TPA: DNA polymerase III subunit beta [Candidatus Pacearchaeota archaeon]|nr:DNA polymerase III subunit beta [Candidatus Pacearchaeota archaeon]HQI74562.1 DNA polymerase III subunit beta [Candidatus Pacearchaeota archaeon]
MKAITLKENFKKGLNIVEKIVGRNLTLPILNNILLKADKNFIILMATNLEIGVKYWVLSKIEKEGSIVVPTKVLSTFISNISDEKISITLKDKKIYLDAKNNKTFIKGLDPEEFPIIPDSETKEFIELDSKAFCEAISSVLGFCSQNQSRRPEITGIYVNFKKDSVDIVATDSYRLGEKNILLKNPINSEFAFILPQRTAQELVNIFSLEDNLKIYYSTNHILFESMLLEVKNPKIHLNSTLIQGEYPNYKDIIPKNFKTKVTIDKDELLNQIKTAGIFTDKNNEMKFDVDSKKKGITIFSQNADIGENESFIEALIEGEDLNICFNYRFLLEGLTNIKSKKISIELNGSDGPSIIRPVGDSSFIYLLMPIKNS